MKWLNDLQMGMIIGLLIAIVTILKKILIALN